MAFAVASQASAQDTTVGEVVVTGSRIVRSDVESVSPITVITAQQIQNSGSIDLGDILRRDPAIGSGGVGKSQNLFGGGAQVVDLRNLGSTRTLVLIDGHRYSLFTDSLQNEGQDLSFIPIAMIDRLEVLRDGASTAYGADAVSGVVNFLLRKDFEGADISAQYGVSGQGDANSYRVSGVIGAGNDRGHVMLGVDVQKQNELFQRDRGLTAYSFFIGTTPLVGSSAAPGAKLYDNNTGDLVECFNNTGGIAAGSCPRWDYSNNQSLITGSKIYDISAAGHYAITDNVELYGTVIYGNRSSVNDLAAQPLFAFSTVGPYLGGLTIPATSTNNPYGVDLALQWRPNQYALRHSTDVGQQLWGTVGLKGDFPGAKFHWDIGTTYSRTTSDNFTESVPNAVHLQRLLDTSQCAADAICAAAGPIANVQNFFAGTETLSAAQQAYGFYKQSEFSTFTTSQTVGTISGPVFTLPAGDLSVALGGEYRRESGKAVSDPVTASGESTANAVFDTSGQFNVKEAFVEIEAPLIKDMPFIQKATLNVQGRYSDFSNFGSTWNYKLGLDWSVNSSLRLRATLGTSFRAPNVVELYGGGVQSYDFIIDPCDTSSGPVTGQTATNCAATGAGPTYTQPAPQLLDLSGGNPALKPEKGRSWTIGAALTPTFLPNFQATVDYYHIKLTDTIARPDLSMILANCYADPTLAARATNIADECYQSNIRTTGGNLVYLNDRWQNLGETLTDGIDFTLRYTFNTLGPIPGSLDVQSRNTWLHRYIQDGFDWAGYIEADIQQAFPRFRSVLNLDYRLNDAWSLDWTTYYTNGMIDIYGSANANTAGVVPLDSPTLGHYTGPGYYVTHDVIAHWRNDTLDIGVGINNVFDHSIPYVFNSGNNTSPETYDVVGRYFFVNARARF